MNNFLMIYMERSKTLLFKGKIDKEDYLFFEVQDFIWSDVHYFSVQTPESDVVLFKYSIYPIWVLA